MANNHHLGHERPLGHTMSFLGSRRPMSCFKRSTPWSDWSIPGEIGERKPPQTWPQTQGISHSYHSYSCDMRVMGKWITNGNYGNYGNTISWESYYFLVPEIFWDFQWLNCHPALAPAPFAARIVRYHGCIRMNSEVRSHGGPFWVG